MSDEKTFRLSDDLIGVVRELLQLSIMTGSNIVDHMRAVRVEVIDGAVVPTEEYIDAYNAQVEQLVKQAEERMEEMQQELAGDQSVH